MTICMIMHVKVIEYDSSLSIKLCVTIQMKTSEMYFMWYSGFIIMYTVALTLVCDHSNNDAFRSALILIKLSVNKTLVRDIILQCVLYLIDVYFNILYTDKHTYCIFWSSSIWTFCHKDSIAGVSSLRMLNTRPEKCWAASGLVECRESLLRREIK